MRNIPLSGNSLLNRGLVQLGSRLPAGWNIERVMNQAQGRPLRADALLTVRAPDGTEGTILVEMKSRLTASGAAALAPKIRAMAAEIGADTGIVMTGYLSPLARERLTQAGLSFLDLAGNVRVSLDRPGLLIETTGADRDPFPEGRGLRSLKGAAAARVVRALCDWHPPVGVRELAQRARTNPGHTTRVLSLLQSEDVIERNAKGEIVGVKWPDLLRRWTRDYGLTRSHTAVPYLVPRGTNAFMQALRTSSERYALTGSAAVPPTAAVAPARVISCYVDDSAQFARELDLRDVQSGHNVVLVEPFDAVVWERRREEEGLTRVALSQCAADLLTGSGREPAEGEALIAWMAENEKLWRA